MIVLRRRLRVAVPAAIRRFTPVTGHGRVWTSVLRELDRLVRLRFADGARPRADVWLVDGHDDPPEGSLPLVAFMSEAPWRMPEVMADVAPEFAALVEGRSRRSAERAARIVCPSEAARRQIADVYGVEAVDVVAHGVDRDRFAGAVPATRPPYVLFASQIHPRKNLGALREAMASLADLGRALVIVGAPAQDRADSAAFEAAAYAPIPGVAVERAAAPDDPALAALMAGADAFCLPSLWEGFGLTALEAMAAGAPVVVSDRGALPEVVGDAGLVVAPEPAAIAAALRDVLTDATLAQRLRDAGRARAAELTWSRTAAGWLAALERAAG